MSTDNRIHIGISGWTYSPWRGSFYPKGLRQADELSYASSIFRSIEINGTFYKLQRPETFLRWADCVPKTFVFAVKAPRYITHTRRLTDVEKPLANFMASGVLALGEKLGPILWQLPPSFHFDEERIAAFLALLPHTTEAAAFCAQQHDSKLKSKPYTDFGRKRKLRHALEIRHDSFCDPRFIKLLRKHNVALVCADTVKWPLLMDVTSDFVYCRLHGSRELYRSAYKPQELVAWANRVRRWASGDTAVDGTIIDTPAKEKPRDVFCFFDNTDKLCAPRDAQALEQALGIIPKDQAA